MRWQKGWAEIPLALDGLAPSGAADRKGLSLRAPSGRLQLRDAGGLRAFLHRIPGGYRLTLSQHQARFRTPRVAAVTDLGTDLRALTHQGRLHRFFDLALGDGAVRIATRSGNPRTVEALHSLCGRRFGAGEVQAKLQGLDDVILVAESPLGRLETMACGSAVPAVKAPILPAGYVALASADIADADALAAAGLDLAAISA